MHANLAGLEVHATFKYHSCHYELHNGVQDCTKTKLYIVNLQNMVEMKNEIDIAKERRIRLGSHTSFSKIYLIVQIFYKNVLLSGIINVLEA